MRSVPLSEVTDFILDGTHGSPERTESGVAVLSAANVTHKGLSLDSGRFTSIQEYNAFKKRLDIKQGDLLLTIVGTIGRATVVQQAPQCVFQRSVAVLRPTAQVLDSNYFYHVSQSTDFQRQLTSLTNTSAQAGIYLGKLKTVTIPLPPLPEQRRIADILDRADALKRKRQQALKLADDFLQATFLDMFGDLGRYPAVVLKDLAVEDGIKCGPFGTQLQRSEFRSEGVPLWGIKQLNKQFKKPTHEFVSIAKAMELSPYSIKSGDLVMTRKGDVGKCAIYPELLGDGVMHSDLVRLRLNKNFCDPYYLLFLLHHSSEFARSLDSISQGAVMAGVNVTKLKSLSIRNAPLERQLRFRKIVQEALAIKDRLQVIDLQVSELAKSITSSVFHAQEVTD